MSTVTPIQSLPSTTYEAPTVTEEPLDEGGNYVSSASLSGDMPTGAGTLGNSIIE